MKYANFIANVVYAKRHAKSLSETRLLTLDQSDRKGSRDTPEADSAEVTDRADCGRSWVGYAREDVPNDVGANRKQVSEAAHGVKAKSQNESDFSEEVEVGSKWAGASVNPVNAELAAVDPPLPGTTGLVGLC